MSDKSLENEDITASAANVPHKKFQVPHDTSTSFVFILAFMVPLTRILRDLYNIYQTDQLQYVYDWHTPRFLQQQGGCIINVTVNETNYVDETYEPPSTMEAIATSLVISFSIGTFSFLLYEAFRRDPIVGKYVYDRKRLTQPTRTPPPLMLSRSLWHGNENQNGRKGWFKWCSWFKVPPALFELYFLTLDENYVRYSKAADEARKEREERGYLTSCDTGCYHNNCCNTVRIGDQYNGDDDEYFVDEDGYLFYPGYNHELGFQHQGDNRHYETPKFSPKNQIMRRNLQGSQGSKSFRSSSASLGDRKHKYSIQDLFPEDFRQALTKIESRGSRHLMANDDDSSDGDLIEDASSNMPAVGEETAEDVSKNGSVVEESSSLNVDTTPDDPMADKIFDHNPEEEPLTSSDNTPIKYPHRLLTFFLPPGFHNWSNALGFVGVFFFKDKLNRRMATARGAVFGNSSKAMSRRHEMKVHEELMILTQPEEELLRCAGLDTYLMIRFARFGFDVCFYPFVFSCVTVFPIYITCDQEQLKEYFHAGEFISSASNIIDGFFSLTINRIPPGSFKMYWIVAFTFCLYFFVLRRLWLEWEIIIKLRHRFLYEGDQNFHDNPTYLKKYRNSVLVECVPKSQQSDGNIRETFEQLFPQQIETAEMVIDTVHLEKELDKRRAFIEKYESIEARYQYQHWMYYNGDKGCCTRKEPAEPKIKESCCGDKESALDFYKAKVMECDESALTTYDKIVESRLNKRDQNRRLESSGGHSSSFSDISEMIREALGLHSSDDLVCSTAIVEFKSLTAKQSAVQCNLVGEPHAFITTEAPDPRDLLWANVICERRYIEKRKLLVEFLLCVFVLLWGAFVATITEVANSSIDGLKLKNYDLTRFRLYVPTLIISLILLWIPKFLFIFAMRVIKFKSFSQCDEFVIKWNTAFRVTNVVFIFFSISLVDAINCFKDDPEKFIQAISIGVLQQSSVLLNLIIIATGQETMLQLLQWRSIIKQALCRPLMNLQSKSRRCLNILNDPPPFEQACIFGYFSPVLSYALIIGMIYSYMAPVMLGACSFFFWVATKVHTHNALFIYCEPFSGGGKIFYYWNRVVFSTLYSSMLIFFGILAMKGFYRTGIAFVIIMLLVTISVDKAITNKFVIHSFNLPIKVARIHDDEEKALLKQSKIKRDGGENFMYRNPQLNHHNWDEKPFRWM